MELEDLTKRVELPEGRWVDIAVTFQPLESGGSRCSIGWTERSLGVTDEELLRVISGVYAEVTGMLSRSGMNLSNSKFYPLQKAMRS